MTHNLFVSRRPDAATGSDVAIATAIRNRGASMQLQDSCWYTKSLQSASEAAASVWSAMQSVGSLAIVDASDGEAAWRNLSPESAEFLREHWREQLLGHAASSASGKGNSQRSGPGYRLPAPARKPRATKRLVMCHCTAAAWSGYLSNDVARLLQIRLRRGAS